MGLRVETTICHLVSKHVRFAGNPYEQNMPGIIEL